MQVMFSVNRYDKDGDVVEKGVYLWFGETSVRVAGGLDDFKKFLERLNGMAPEIEEVWKGEN